MSNEKRNTTKKWVASTGKQTRSVYVHKELWDAAIANEADINGEVNKLLSKLAKPQVCPCCGQARKKS